MMYPKSLPKDWFARSFNLVASKLLHVALLLLLGSVQLAHSQIIGGTNFGTVTRPTDGAAGSGGTFATGIYAPIVKASNSQDVVMRIDMVEGTTVIESNTYVLGANDWVVPNETPKNLTRSFTKTHNFAPGTHTIFLRSSTYNLLEDRTQDYSFTVTGSTNTPPSAFLTAPSNGATFDVAAGAFASVIVSGYGTDPDAGGAVTKLELLDNGVVKFTANANTLDTTLSVGIGSHTIELRPTDNTGAVGPNAVITVTVRQIAATAAALSFGTCIGGSPTISPTAASITCPLSNTGGTSISSITYAPISGMVVSGGPTSCGANALCGNVTVTSGVVAQPYNGSLTATPNTGSAAQITINLTVNPPAAVDLSIENCTPSLPVPPVALPSNASLTCSVRNPTTKNITSFALSSATGVITTKTVGTCNANSLCGQIKVSTNGTVGRFVGSINITTNAGDGPSGSINFDLQQDPAVPQPNIVLACTPDLPTTSPTPATVSCNVTNSGAAAATSINYSVSGTGLNIGVGPTGGCNANSLCGTIKVSTNTAQARYQGTLTATPNVGTAASYVIDLTVKPPVAGLNLGTCNIVSSTASPTPASISCPLSNTGLTAVSSITYSGLPATLHASGPTTCPANGACGTVVVTTDPLVARYVGNLTLTPNTGAGTVLPVDLTVQTVSTLPPTISITGNPDPMIANSSRSIRVNVTNTNSVNYVCTASGTGYKGNGTVTVLNVDTPATLADPDWVGFDSQCTYTATGPVGTKQAIFTMHTIRAAQIGNAPTATLSATPRNLRVAPGLTGTVNFTGLGTDSDGQVVRLDLFQDSGSGAYAPVPVKTTVGASGNVPFSYAAALPAGTYRFKLRSTDNSGNFTDSTPVVINITDSSLLGTVSGVRTNSAGVPELFGWVCQSAVQQSLRYSVYVNAPPQLGGMSIATGVANVSTEVDNLAIQTQCQTVGVAHHFTVDLSSFTNPYPGAQLFVQAQAATGNSNIVLPCDDNNCTMPGSLRIGLTTPADNSLYTAPASVFLRAQLSNGTGLYDEIAFAVDGVWTVGLPDSAIDTYYVNKTGLAARVAPYIVMARVKQGNSTIYSVANRVYVSAANANSIVLNTPVNLNNFNAGAEINLKATTSGPATNVKFYTVISSSEVFIADAVGVAGVWTAKWVNSQAGTYNIMARAFDGSGVPLAQSLVANIMVSAGSASAAGTATVDVLAPHLTNADAGSLPGDMMIGNDGAASYNIPIVVPPGSNGMVPSLSLNYSSAGGNSLVGLGWSLGGMSSVHRCGKTIAQDGINDRIRFAPSDRLCIDGKRLVLLNNAAPSDAQYWADNAEFRTEIESFSRITAQGSMPNRWFKVESKDGHISSYGNSTSSVVLAVLGTPNSGKNAPVPIAKTGPQSWAITRTEDRSRNYINYIYEQDLATGEHRPKEINYGGSGLSSHGGVQFTYETRPDAWKKYIDETRNDLRNRLAVIKTYVGTNLDLTVANGTLVRNYLLKYEISPTSGRSLLNEVQAWALNPQSTAMDPLPKTTFNWGKPDPAKTAGFESKGMWAGAPILTTGTNTAAYHQDYFAFADFEGNGYTDVLEKRKANPRQPAQISTASNPIAPGTLFQQYRYFHNNGAGFTQYNYTLNTNELFVVLEIGDFNGDGAPDILVATSAATKVCFSPLAQSKGLISPSTPIVFTCDTVSLPVGGNDLGVSPYLVDILGDGRSAIYSKINTAGSAQLCIQGVCQTDLTPPYRVLTQTRGAVDDLPQDDLQAYISYEQTVDFAGLGKPNDVRWSRPKFIHSIPDAGGGNPIIIDQWYNLTPTVVTTNFHLPQDASGTGVIADYVYPYVYTPCLSSGCAPYLFDVPEFGGSLNADFNGSGYAGLAFGFIERTFPNGIFSYGRAEMTLCLSTGRALDCAVRKKFSGDQYPSTQTVGNFVGDGQPKMLALNMKYQPGVMPPAPDGTIKICRVTGDDSTAGVGTNDTNMACDTWGGLSFPIVTSSTIGDKILYMDLLGNGTTQLVYYHSGKLDASQVWREDGRWEVFAPIDVASPGQALDRIYKVTNGIGATATVSYVDSKTSGAVLQSGMSTLQYPQHTTPRVGKIAAKLTVSNGISNGTNVDRVTTYRFWDNANDVAGRGSLGFAKVEQTDQLTGLATTTNFSQTWPYTGMSIASSTVATKDGNVVVSTSTNTPDFIGANGVVFPYIKTNITTRRDLNGDDMGTATSTNQYTDGWGNLNQQDIVAVGAGGTFTTTTKNDFYNNGTTWIIGRPKNSSVTKTDPVVTSAPRIMSYEIDANGLVKTETQMPLNMPYQVITRYDRSLNPFGLVNKKTQEWLDPYTQTTQAPRTVSDVTYDANGRFAITVKNALGHTETHTYANATGAHLSLTGPNGLITSWMANGFGRVLKETRADGNQTFNYIKQCQNDCPSGAVVASIIDSFNGGVRNAVPIVSYSDNAGHVLSTVTWGFDGRKIITDQRYQDGRLFEVDQARYESATSYLDHRQFYDNLNRIIKVQTLSNSGAVLDSTTDYRGYRTTLTNPKVQKRIDYHDVLGRTIQVDSYLAARAITTRFAYDPFGNLVNTIDPNTNVIAVTYDALGRKTDLIDPDLGRIHYDVDPLGRTWKQTSPNQLQAWTAATPAQRLATNFFTRMEFDIQDRMTGRYEMDLESHWIFDALPAQDCKLTRSCGQLIEAYTGQAATKDYRRLAVYDSLGRHNQTTQVLKDASYVSTTVFDNWGRPITQRYQRGSDPAKVYDSRYNNKGYLTRIERGSLVLWQVNSQDAAQRITSARLGNGIVQTRNFNLYNGRVDDGQIANVNGAVRLSEVYNYDAIGNVLNRNQYWDQNGFSEVFEYDDLNRLSKSSVAGQASQNFSFDDAGSILNKTNKGTYHYPAQGSNAIRPHAVTSIDNTDSTIDNYLYDGNGNLTSGAGRNIVWNSFDMPVSIAKGSNANCTSGSTISSCFVYGPEHQRTRQNSNDGKQIVYAGAQEVESKAGQITIKTYWPHGLGVEIDRPSVAFTEHNFTLTDRLGSPIAISDSTGILRERLAYDAWGKRRTLDGSATPDGLDGVTDNKGYTGHEMLDQLDLVHMNGRVYDPLTAKFLSGDPLIQDPTNGQNYNRYSYVLNNPTNMTDPTGFQSKCNEDSSLTSCGGGDWKTSGASLTNGELALVGRSNKPAAESTLAATPTTQARDGQQALKGKGLDAAKEGTNGGGANLARASGAVGRLGAPGQETFRDWLGQKILNFVLGSPEANAAWGQAYQAAKAQGKDAENEFLRHNPPPSFESTKIGATVVSSAVGQAGAGTVSLFRAVGIREGESIAANKAFLSGGNSLEGRQFAKTFDEAMQYAREDLSKVSIYEVRIQKNALPAFDFSKTTDPHIFVNGVYTIQPGVQMQIFNNAVKAIEHAY